ncbi:hypothetical protein MASR2M15_22990 [Anaerolineales bacterium]
MSFIIRLPNNIYITNTRREHARGIEATVRSAYDIDPDEDCDASISADDVLQQIARFPEGQFVAIHRQRDREEVVAMASTMRTSYSPYDQRLPWREQIGSLGIVNHEPSGDWLYGVEMAVRPDFRRMGIASAMYKVRFDFIKRLNLRGWYSGGMLMGYHRYSDKMSPKQYGENVIAGHLVDPTVTMQMNRGFEGHSVIENYTVTAPESGNAAVLIIWKNPDFKE